MAGGKKGPRLLVPEGQGVRLRAAARGSAAAPAGEQRPASSELGAAARSAPSSLAVTFAGSAAPVVTIVGAGLAGCEAALQLAARGIEVRLFEQKPHARTPAQSRDQLCELVCSNSFRGAQLTNAVGLLKEEMRRLGSFVMQAADVTRVPAGGALAVDRERFSAKMARARARRAAHRARERRRRAHSRGSARA